MLVLVNKACVNKCMDTEIITEKTQSYGYYHISKKKTNLQNLHNFDTEMCYLHKILSKSVKQSSTIIFDEKIICNVMGFFFWCFQGNRQIGSCLWRRM